MKRSRQAPKKTLVVDARVMVSTCVGINVRFAERRITRFLEAQFRTTGLSVAKFGLMAHIAAAREDTIGSLAERSGLDQSTLSRSLQALEQEGLVEIVTAETDMRRRGVWLTEMGARRLEAAIPTWRKANERLSAMVDHKAITKMAASVRALPP
jgi:DNA-binding MarR family transcriptional regulator